MDTIPTAYHTTKKCYEPWSMNWNWRSIDGKSMLEIKIHQTKKPPVTSLFVSTCRLFAEGVDSFECLPLARACKGTLLRFYNLEPQRHLAKTWGLKSKVTVQFLERASHLHEGFANSGLEPLQKESHGKLFANSGKHSISPGENYSRRFPKGVAIQCPGYRKSTAQVSCLEA